MWGEHHVKQILHVALCSLQAWCSNEWESADMYADGGDESRDVVLACRPCRYACVQARMHGPCTRHVPVWCRQYRQGTCVGWCSWKRHAQPVSSCSTMMAIHVVTRSLVMRAMQHCQVLDHV